MLKVLSLILLLLSASVSAAPMCWPKEIGGTGEGLVRGSLSGVGQWAAYWCPQPAGWTSTLLTMRDDYQIKHPPDAGSKPLGKLVNDYWTLNVSTDCASPELCAAARAAAVASRPPASVWKVPAGTAADGSRPTSLIVDGALKATTFRVPAGEPCECTRLSFSTGSNDYCGVRGLPNVALCRKQ